MHVAVIAITAGGAQLGQQLCANMAHLDLYVSDRYADRSACACKRFKSNELRTLISSLWQNHDGLVLIMATGIVVRMIAPLLKSKEADPAIVVIDDAGTFAISLLSGHLGGGNELTAQCAAATGACPVITTATDANGLPSFDMLARTHGWAIDDISKVKTLNTLLLDNEEIAVIDPGGLTRAWLNGRGRTVFYNTAAEAATSAASGFLCVTNRLLPDYDTFKNMLILRPRNLVLGIGCNRGTPADEIDELVTLHLAKLALSSKSICCIASVSAKRDEAGLLEYAERLGIKLRCFESDELNRVGCPSPPSAHAMAAIGVIGVAEPAAILASDGGQLLLKKVKSANVTLAIAERREGYVICQNYR